MATKIIDANYEAMIAALYRFSSTVYVKSSEMQTHASVCTQALGEGDQAAAAIYTRIRDCHLKYAEATERAKTLAQLMQAELDRKWEEDKEWSNDE